MGNHLNPLKQVTHHGTRSYEGNGKEQTSVREKEIA